MKTHSNIATSANLFSFRVMSNRCDDDDAFVGVNQSIGAEETGENIWSKG